jgi:Xaa-Pro aminopeptidase
MAPLSVAGRLDRVRTALAEQQQDGILPDALLVTTTANLRWLTGFTGSAGVLLVGPERAVLATDGRYRIQAADQLAGSGVADQIDLAIGGVVAQRESLTARAVGAAAVGLEAGDVTWSAASMWESVFDPLMVVATQGIVEGGEGRRRGGPHGAGRGHRRFCAPLGSPPPYRRWERRRAD